MTKKRIGWIGAGNLGTPICRNLLRAGFEVAVFDVDPTRVTALQEDGATDAPSAVALLEKCAILVTALNSERILLDVIGADGGLASALSRKNLYVDISTISPGVSAEIAEILAPTGARYIRAPVSGSTQNAAAGTLSMYCSGPRDAYDELQDVISTIAHRHSYAGDGEQARVLKLLINMIVIATPALIGEALHFGESSGLERDQIVDAILASVGASPVIKYKEQAIKARDWTPAATIDLTEKDLALALKWAEEIRTPMSFTQLTYDLTRQFQTAGDGDKDFFYTSTWPEQRKTE